MTSAASRIIIDQWVTAVPVAPEPAHTVPPQLPAPVQRVYSEEVWARARQIDPMPRYWTRDELDRIAAELDTINDAKLRGRRGCNHEVRAEDEYSASGIYGAVGMCTPGRGDTFTGR